VHACNINKELLIAINSGNDRFYNVDCLLDASQRCSTGEHIRLQFSTQTIEAQQVKLCFLTTIYTGIQLCTSI